MRTFKNLTAFVLIMVLAGISSAFAADGDKKTPKVTAKEKIGYSLYAVQNTMIFRFAFENESDENVKVSVYDEAGREVRSDVYRNESGRIAYDLSAVGQGVYTVKIKAGDFVSERKLGLGVKEAAGNFAAYVSPGLKDGHAVLACENGKGGIYISLTDSEGAILYSEHTSNTEIARKLDLNQLEAGTYNLQLTSGEKTVERIYVVK